MNDTATPRPATRNPVLTGIVGLCIGLVVAYGVGLWQRSAALTAQADANAAVVAAKDGEIAAGAERLAESAQNLLASEGRSALFSIRLDIYRALNDLDQRNFGVAGDRLTAAAGRFDTIDAAALGMDPAVLASLKADLASIQVLVATDFEAQRIRLLEVAARIEAQTAAALEAPAVETPAVEAPVAEAPVAEPAP